MADKQELLKAICVKLLTDKRKTYSDELQSIHHLLEKAEKLVKPRLEVIDGCIWADDVVKAYNDRVTELPRSLLHEVFPF